MGSPLSRVLIDFGAATTPRPATQASAPLCIVPPADPADDLARRIDEAFARGADEARLAADAEQEQQLAQAKLQAEEARAADRAQWTREQADELAARLSGAVEGLETRIADAVGRVLMPFLTDGTRRKCVEALADSIRALLSGGSRPALRVSGPEDLLAALRDRLGAGVGAGAVAIEWEPNEAVEVTVTAEDSVIETEMQGWIDRFGEPRP